MIRAASSRCSGRRDHRQPRARRHHRRADLVAELSRDRLRGAMLDASPRNRSPPTTRCATTPHVMLTPHSARRPPRDSATCRSTCARACATRCSAASCRARSTSSAASAWSGSELRDATARAALGRHGARAPRRSRRARGRAPHAASRPPARARRRAAALRRPRLASSRASSRARASTWSTRARRPRRAASRSPSRPTVASDQPYLVQVTVRQRRRRDASLARGDARRESAHHAHRRVHRRRHAASHDARAHERRRARRHRPRRNAARRRRREHRRVPPVAATSQGGNALAAITVDGTIDDGFAAGCSRPDVRHGHHRPFRPGVADAVRPRASCTSGARVRPSRATHRGCCACPTPSRDPRTSSDVAEIIRAATRDRVP